jgi:hypothetical protein
VSAISMLTLHSGHSSLCGPIKPDSPTAQGANTKALSIQLTGEHDAAQHVQASRIVPFNNDCPWPWSSEPKVGYASLG